MNKPFLYKLGIFLLKPLFKFYYSPIIIGKENILKDERIIIASNHIHLYDQCHILISTKRYINYLAKKEYFDSILTRWFFKGVGCIPVDRNNKDQNAISSAIKVLENNGAIGIFPEGTRNRTNKKLLDFKYGCVSIAKKTDSYIIPVGIKGTYKFKSHPVVKIGLPFKVTDLDLNTANSILYEKIKELI